MANEKFKVKFGLAVGDTQATIDGTTGDIVTIGDLNVNGGNIRNTLGPIDITSGVAGNITIQPDTTGGIILAADTVQVGDSGVAATITTNGNAGLTIATSGGNNLSFSPASPGQTVVNSQLDVNGNIVGDLLQIDNIQIDANSILTTDTNGSITLDPNGTGNVVVTLANGGNLTNDRNYVFGAIRNSTSAAAGDIWTNGPAGTGYRGISLDNSADTTKGPNQVLRSYSGGAVSGSGTRGRVILEKSRGTSASPTAVQQSDALGSVEVTGYTSTGWVNDLVATSTGNALFAAAENWVSNTNLGTQYQLFLAPTATTISSGANVLPVMSASPQSLSFRSDAFGISKAKTNAFTATGSSISGTTLTIGTVISGTVAVGQVLIGSNITPFGAYIVSNISGSGSGSTWTISQSITAASATISGLLGYVGSNGTTLDALADLRLLKNNIQGSGGLTAITMTSDNTFTTLVGDTFKVNNAAGTNYFEVNKDGSNHIVANINQTRATTGDEFAIVNFTTQRSTDGINYTPTLLNDVIGSFKFNGNANTSTSPGVPAGPGAQITATATENWSSIANGTRFNFSAVKKGAITDVVLISTASDSTTFKSDAYTFQDSSSTNVVGSKITYNRVYGQFQYDTTVSPVAADTAYVFPLGTADINNIATVGSTSRLIAGAAGVYNLQFSVQVDNNDNSNDHDAYVWLRKNGSDVTGSMGRVTVPKNNAGSLKIIAWNYLVSSANVTDYWEIAYAVSDTDVTFPAFAATAFGPSTACIITSLTPVGA
jgi:hypothetical protein